MYRASKDHKPLTYFVYGLTRPSSKKINLAEELTAALYLIRCTDFIGEDLIHGQSQISS